MTSDIPPTGSAEAPLDIARRFAPQIIERAAEFEAARRIPADFARKLAEAGLYRLTLPAEIGGYELHPKEYVRVIEELARADGSLGWCVMIGTTNALLAAFLPTQTMREIFASDPHVITGGAAAPSGKALPVEGGYKVSGRWKWGSGSQNCAWLDAGAVVVDAAGAPQMRPDGQPEIRTLFFAVDQVEIIDLWETSGLRATGSNDFQATEVFVTKERSLVLGYARRVVDRPLYRMPFFGLLAVGVCAVALGIARRAIDELIALAVRKTPTWERDLLKDSVRVQTAVAEAEAALRSARAFLFETIDAAWDSVHMGRRAPLELHRDLRLAAVNAAWQSRKAVDLAYDQGGGSSIFASHPLQRCLRDAHTVTQHVMVNPAMWESTGRLFLGTRKLPAMF
ncbi:MAG TPA: acyl-CoA dehydrogenase family protein [Candidatus Binataceae bacterium]|nr:acyl-CoA dehydrogenase family protein [Candidatus Binataceae bacterium]